MTRFDGEPVFVCRNLSDIVRTPASKVKSFVYKDLLMTLQALQTPRFVRRTQLGPNEYRKNFRQIDGDVISAITSSEADRVTPLMSKIYLRLVHAPTEYWERDGVLHFQGEVHGNTHVKAWDALCKAVGVASATANKALRWMHEQGIIGYFAGKNGVGIRIFLNRASSSIGTRTTGKKILDFPRASPAELPASTDEAAFNDSYADLDVSDTDLYPRAPESGADTSREVNTPSVQQPAVQPPPPSVSSAPSAGTSPTISSEEITKVFKVLIVKIGRSLSAATEDAAAREHERTRQWLENRGLPKMIRVAQRETFNLLRQHLIFNQMVRKGRADVGRASSTSPEPRRLSEHEIMEMAQACIAMLETKGQSVEQTLSGMGAATGGFLLPEDAPRVREKAASILRGASGETGKDKKNV
jgi:hypothetical protein